MYKLQIIETGRPNHLTCFLKILLFSFIYGFFVNLLIYSAAHPGHKLLGEVMCDTVCRGVVSDSHVVAHRPTRTLKFDFSDEASSLSG